MVSKAVISSFFILGILSLFVPKAELWDYWLPHDPDSTAVVDHGAWDAFLKKSVVPGNDGINRLAYGGVGRTDRKALEDYLSTLSEVPVRSLRRDEQLAYWINLYNALTVKVILDHYPVKSIRSIDISPGFFSDGPWGKPLVRVEGKEMTLNDMEHRVLRPIWKDPRIHYAVNCASLGCPNLQPRAFTAENAEELLALAAREYVNHPRGVSVDKGWVRVSSIYVWFKEDFGGTDEGVIEHLRRHASGALPEELRRVDGISEHHYDWSLNDAR
jgi:hypothetical protein